jgi:thiosulfate dehydrogenase
MHLTAEVQKLQLMQTQSAMQNPDNEKHQVILYTAKQGALVSLLFVLCGLIYLSAVFIDPNQVSVRKANLAAVPGKNSAAPKQSSDTPKLNSQSATNANDAWQAPLEVEIPAGKAGAEIRYGRELIAHTAKYFGPKGKIAKLSNGMNCQNCHLEAGTKLFANNYSVFYANYPKKGARSGKTDQVTDRISDCFKRSLAGKMPDKNSKEIKAMIRYFAWVGGGARRGEKLPGTATEKLPFLDRPADPKKGLLVYQEKCKSCHGAEGQGQKAADELTYLYPPLWGKSSYSDAAGMYRLSNFAGFVKNNMPFGVDFRNPQLSNEEAWDVAAYVNTRPRPHRDQRKDYPDLAKKPIDAPYGPYGDEFPALQHKLGPFKPIVEYTKLNAQKK